METNPKLQGKMDLERLINQYGAAREKMGRMDADTVLQESPENAAAFEETQKKVNLIHKQIKRRIYS